MAIKFGKLVAAAHEPGDTEFIHSRLSNCGRYLIERRSGSNLGVTFRAVTVDGIELTPGWVARERTAKLYCEADASRVESL